MPGRISSLFGRRAFRVGDYAEVRPLDEIVRTLDADGALDGMPFMPEMARCCGRRYRVVKSAHKTCDPTGLTNLRRLPDAVHLETRCDGSAHDGCQAGCLFFWRREWLRPVDGATVQGVSPASSPEIISPSMASGLQTLQRATRTPGIEPGEIRYRCQATEVSRFSTPLSSYEPTQYVSDFLSGNVSFAAFVKHLVSAIVKGAGRSILGAHGANAIKQMLRRKRDDGASAKVLRPREAQQNGISLQPGDVVRVRPTSEIRATLDETGRNRGLTFDEDMAQRAGRTFRVSGRVHQVIDEGTGKMLRIRKDCLILEGVSCIGHHNRNRLFCPRGALLFWREAWLEPVAEAQGPIQVSLSGGTAPSTTAASLPVHNPAQATAPAELS
jgi:hypothetical protein